MIRVCRWRCALHAHTVLCVRYNPPMGRTIGIMVTMTTYGTWLRGDQRGWIDDGMPMPPDLILQANDQRRLAYSAFRFDRGQLREIGLMIGRSLIDRLDAVILALTVQTWHAHFVIGATRHDIGAVVKCAKDAVRYGLRLGRPVWTDGYDKRFCFDEQSLVNRVRYVERHEQTTPGAEPWPFVTPVNTYLARQRTPPTAP